MATISSFDDIFTIRAPGLKEGDTVDILDENNVPRRVRLTIPMGKEFAFRWFEKPAETSGDDGEAKFVKRDGVWMVQTSEPHEPGDVVVVSKQDGVQEVILGDQAADNLFYRMNHFVRNPSGSSPRWCVRVYGNGAKPGDIIRVAKKDHSTQKHLLVEEVHGGVWTVKKA